MTDVTCIECAYSAKNDENSIACRRFPPHITKVEGKGNQQNISSHFPILANGAWCGEWRPKPDIQ